MQFKNCDSEVQIKTSFTVKMVLLGNKCG